MKEKNCSSTFVMGAAVLGFALAAFVPLRADAKLEFPAPSPECTIKQRIGLSDIEIVYSRPGVKNREIFGGLVPYGKVWRTGANKASKLVFSTPVKLNGNEVAAGTYALMTIPGEKEWTIIINKAPEQWGSYQYDEKQDLLRFKVLPLSLSRPVETFTIEFSDIKDDSAELDLSWEKTQVPIKVTVDYIDNLKKQVAELMDSDQKDKPYYQAASFYFRHDGDLQKAKEWVDKAIADRQTHYFVYLKAEILAKLGDKEGAIAAAKLSTELAEKANDPGFVKLNADLLSKLK